MSSDGTGATPASAPPATMKLLVDTGAQPQRVLFAQAGKDVIDFLLGLLAMPSGAMIKLLGSKDKDSPLGALANLYASAQHMDPEYMQSPETRDALLNPAPAHPALVAAAGGFPSLVQHPAAAAAPHPPPPPPPVPAPPGPSCRASPGLSLKGLPLPAPFNVGGGASCHYDAYLAAQQAQERRGFVRALVTYTIMDDLTVTPMSNISSIAMLHRLGVEDVGALEERTVKIGYQEGLEILKASLNKSKTVLTDVFLAKRKEKRPRTPADKNEKEKRGRTDTAEGKVLAIDE